MSVSPSSVTSNPARAPVIDGMRCRRPTGSTMILMGCPDRTVQRHKHFSGSVYQQWVPVETVCLWTLTKFLNICTWHAVHTETFQQPSMDSVYVEPRRSRREDHTTGYLWWVAGINTTNVSHCSWGLASPRCLLGSIFAHVTQQDDISIWLRSSSCHSISRWVCYLGSVFWQGQFVSWNNWIHSDWEADSA